MEALDAIPWGALTPSALLLLAVLLIFRGDVVPRHTVPGLPTPAPWLRLLQRSHQPGYRDPPAEG